jgi:hypothetical protein
VFELNEKEKEVLLNFLGVMNGYEIMGVLCKFYGESELQDANNTLLRIVRKLQDDIDVI